MERRLAAILAADVAGYSRLMSLDEAGTLASLQAHRSEVVDPAIARHRGRIVKLMGDGMLAEFGSVVEAVECAAEIQCGMATRNAAVPEDRRLGFRIGVHLGDVITQGDDIYGDGVNIAARLESLAETGGICISRQAYDQIDGKLALDFRELGPQQLKNIPKPIEVFAIGNAAAAQQAKRAPIRLQQEIRYCRARDGVRLAYATVGQGPTLVRTAHWFNHLEYDWTSPIWGHILRRLAGEYTLIRYDARGNGLSDWEVPEVSLDTWVDDLETVVDTVGLKRFPLLAVSQGCAVSIAYTVRHPERVSQLILYGGFALGAGKRSPAGREKQRAMATLMRLEWGSDNPSLRNMFATEFFPDASKALLDGFTERQRLLTTGECAARYLEAVGEFDVVHLLPPVKVPTLVMHRRGDLRVPFELGRQLATGIPGARFVALDGRNHVPLEGEPAAERYFEEIRLFLGN